MFFGTRLRYTALVMVGDNKKKGGQASKMKRVKGVQREKERWAWDESSVGMRVQSNRNGLGRLPRLTNATVSILVHVAHG